MWCLARAVLAAAALGLFHSNVSAQVFALSAGASTMYGAEGATLMIRGKGYESSIGAGLSNGHFAIGGTSVRQIKDGSLTAGQQGFSMELPTDVFQGGHIFFGAGLGLRRQRTDQDGLNLFAGYTSFEGGTPLFQTSSLGNLAAFGQWKKQLSTHCSSLATGLLSTKVIALESVQCARSRHLVYSFTAGVGAGAPYVAASVIWKKQNLDLRASYILAGSRFQRGNNFDQPTPEPIRENISADYRLTRNVSFTAMHQNYLTPATSNSGDLDLPDEPQRSSLDVAAVLFHRGRTGLTFTVLHAKTKQVFDPSEPSFYRTNLALSAAFQHSFGRIEWTENFMDELSGQESGGAILINGISAEINSHLRLTESANVTAQGLTFSHGGSLVTTFSSVSVGYELLYLANRPYDAFQKSLIFDAQVAVRRNLWVHAGSSVGPTGKILYSFQLGTQFSRNGATSDRMSDGGMGNSILSGRVVDLEGIPVEGAAMLIGHQRVYSDSDGNFLFREKKSQVHPFTILLDEFLGSGRFASVRAPREIRTSSQRDSAILSIVVARIPEIGPGPRPFISDSGVPQPMKATP